MKKCLACRSVYPSSAIHCSVCGTEPKREEGVTVYAPAPANGGEGFRDSYFSDLASLEESHFWFRTRNRLIIWALGAYCPQFRSFLEIGCGTGYVISGIARKYPKTRVSGSELFAAGLSFALRRMPAGDFMQIDARDIPFVDEFDVIGAFDVLEHIKEDDQVLVQMHNAVKPGGVILVTVPQHAWLWSPIDEYACHVRRYSADELEQKMKNAGFEILRSTSFVFSLLPAMAVSRMLYSKKSSGERDATAELKISGWLNRLFEKMLDMEVFMIRIGLNFPLGGSRFVIARKLV